MHIVVLPIIVGALLAVVFGVLITTVDTGVGVADRSQGVIESLADKRNEIVLGTVEADRTQILLDNHSTRPVELLFAEYVLEGSKVREKVSIHPDISVGCNYVESESKNTTKTGIKIETNEQVVLNLKDLVCDDDKGKEKQINTVSFTTTNGNKFDIRLKADAGEIIDALNYNIDPEYDPEKDQEKRNKDPLCQYDNPQYDIKECEKKYGIERIQEKIVDESKTIIKIQDDIKKLQSGSGSGSGNANGNGSLNDAFGSAALSGSTGKINDKPFVNLVMLHGEDNIGKMESLKPYIFPDKNADFAVLVDTGAGESLITGLQFFNQYDINGINAMPKQSINYITDRISIGDNLDISESRQLRVVGDGIGLFKFVDNTNINLKSNGAKITTATYTPLGLPDEVIGYVGDKLLIGNEYDICEDPFVGTGGKWPTIRYLTGCNSEVSANEKCSMVMERTGTAANTGEVGKIYYSNALKINCVIPTEIPETATLYAKIDLSCGDNYNVRVSQYSYDAEKSKQEIEHGTYKLTKNEYDTQLSIHSLDIYNVLAFVENGNCQFNPVETSGPNRLSFGERATLEHNISGKITLFLESNNLQRDSFIFKNTDGTRQLTMEDEKWLVVSVSSGDKVLVGKNDLTHDFLVIDSNKINTPFQLEYKKAVGSGKVTTQLLAGLTNENGEIKIDSSDVSLDAMPSNQFGKFGSLKFYDTFLISRGNAFTTNNEKIIFDTVNNAVTTSGADKNTIYTPTTHIRIPVQSNITLSDLKLLPTGNNAPDLSYINQDFRHRDAISIPFIAGYDGITMKIDGNDHTVLYRDLSGFDIIDLIPTQTVTVTNAGNEPIQSAEASLSLTKTAISSSDSPIIALIDVSASGMVHITNTYTDVIKTDKEIKRCVRLFDPLFAYLQVYKNGEIVDFVESTGTRIENDNPTFETYKSNSKRLEIGFNDNPKQTPDNEVIRTIISGEIDERESSGIEGRRGNFFCENVNLSIDQVITTIYNVKYDYDVNRWGKTITINDVKPGDVFEFVINVGIVGNLPHQHTLDEITIDTRFWGPTSVKVDTVRSMHATSIAEANLLAGQIIIDQ